MLENSRAAIDIGVPLRGRVNGIKKLAIYFGRDPWATSTYGYISLRIYKYT
jgi:hypothetical protein